ncbi:MAG: TIGR04551 family protein [Myxococcales bacterium]|nr:TIGR04551 family protein [Myxococcales bacterium]
MSDTHPRGLKAASLHALPALALLCTGLLAAPAWAQPGLGGAGPGGPGGPPGGPGQGKDKKEGPAEEAPKDKQALRPIEEVPAQPARRRRVQLFDLHGYMRMRGDYFHRLNLGIDDFDSNDEPLPNKFFRPPAETGEYREEAGRTTFVANDADCFARLTQAGVSLQRATTRCQRRNGIPSANLRLRLEPTLHITDTVKVHSQVDLLDNVVLGSTPDTFLYDNPNAPIDLYTRSQVPPSSGVNSFDDSIVVKRAWGHVRFGFGLDLQFGRMPWSWGMGLVANHGNGYARLEDADIIRHLDRDYGDSVDSVRLAFDFGKDRRRTHTLALSWDWASSGPTNAFVLGNDYNSGRLVGQTISAEKFDNVYQWSASIERRDDVDMLRRKLALGSPVLNYGVMTWLRYQDIDIVEGAWDAISSGLIDSPYNELLVARRAYMVTPDLWMRVNWRTLRVELEAAGNFGTFRALSDSFTQDDRDDPSFYESVTADDLERKVIANFGYALEFKYGLFKDRFHIGFDQGFATGDNAISPNSPDVGAAIGVADDNNLVSNFRFNPAYNIDMLMFREILGTVSNAAYFKPWAAFYFFDNFSARIDAEYAVAANRLSTIGRRYSYGIELDGALRYHDRREPIFFQVQYGVLFPLAAFNRLRSDGAADDARAVQTVQGQFGIRF